MTTDSEESSSMMIELKAGARDMFFLVVCSSRAVTWILPSLTAVVKECRLSIAGASSRSPVQTLKQARGDIN